MVGKCRCHQLHSNILPDNIYKLPNDHTVTAGKHKRNTIPLTHIDHYLIELKIP